MVEIAKIMTDKVVGYIHVSPLKQSEKKNPKYFDLQVLLSPKCYCPQNAIACGVCFPQQKKRDQFETYSKQKLPVKSKNCTPKDEGQ